MPQMPYTKADQDKLLDNGKAVILHQPMEAHTRSEKLARQKLLSSAIYLQRRQ